MLSALADAVASACSRPRQERRRERVGRLRIVESTHAHPDLSSLGETHTVRTVGGTVGADIAEALMPQERPAETEAALDFVDDERASLRAGQEAQRAMKPRRQIAIATFALHRLDDHAEVHIAVELLGDRGQRVELRGEPRVVAPRTPRRLNVGRRPHFPPSRRIVGRVIAGSDRRGHEVHLVASDLERSALGRVVTGVEREEGAAVKRALERDETLPTGRVVLHREGVGLLVRLGAAVGEAHRAKAGHETVQRLRERPEVRIVAERGVRVHEERLAKPTLDVGTNHRIEREPARMRGRLTHRVHHAERGIVDRDEPGSGGAEVVDHRRLLFAGHVSTAGHEPCVDRARALEHSAFREAQTGAARAIAEGALRFGSFFARVARFERVEVDHGLIHGDASMARWLNGRYRRSRQCVAWR